jgi:hypothetical protein
MDVRLPALVEVALAASALAQRDDAPNRKCSPFDSSPCIRWPSVVGSELQWGGTGSSFIRDKRPFGLSMRRGAMAAVHLCSWRSGCWRSRYCSRSRHCFRHARGLTLIEATPHLRSLQRARVSVPVTALVRRGIASQARRRPARKTLKRDAPRRPQAQMASGRRHGDRAVGVETLKQTPSPSLGRLDDPSAQLNVTRRRRRTHARRNRGQTAAHFHTQ